MRPALVRSFTTARVPRWNGPALARLSAFALLALAVALAVAGGASAADQAGKSEAAAAAKPAARPSPAYLAAMKRFLVAQNIPAQMGDQMTYSAAEQVLSPLASQGIAVTEQMQAIVLEEARKEFGKRYGDVDYLTNLYAGIYVKHFDEKEVGELAAFWESPVATKLLATTPKINEAFAVEMQTTTGPMLTEFQSRVEKRLREAGILSNMPAP